MARKFYTCIIVPDASQALHKLRIPIRALYVLAAIGVLSFFVAVGLGFHYIGMASRIENLHTLEAENAKLKVDTRQLRLTTTQLSRRIDALEDEADIITKAMQEDPLLRKLTAKQLHGRCNEQRTHSRPGSQPDGEPGSTERPP